MVGPVGTELPAGSPQSFLHETNQLSSWNLQCICKVEDRGQCRTLFRAFDSAYMATFGPGSLGKLILRKRLAQAQFLKHLTKNYRRQFLVPHRRARFA